MTIPIEIIVALLGIIVTIIGYFLKKQIEEVNDNIKELANQKSESRERILKLEVNYDNLISTIHQLSTLIENTQETMNNLTLQMSDLKADIKAIKK